MYTSLYTSMYTVWKIRIAAEAMMAVGGYPWTIIPVERRTEYMTALESASVGQNIKPFAEFLASLIKRENT